MLVAEGGEIVISSDRDARIGRHASYEGSHASECDHCAGAEGPGLGWATSHGVSSGRKSQVEILKEGAVKDTCYISFAKSKGHELL